MRSKKQVDLLRDPELYHTLNHVIAAFDDCHASVEGINSFLENMIQTEKERYVQTFGFPCFKEREEWSPAGNVS